MKPNNLLGSSGSHSADIRMGITGHNVQNYYLNALFSINITTPSPPEEYVVFQNPESFHRIVEIVSILAALAVGAIIIVGVAIIMSKLRKRNIQEEVESHNMEVIVDNSAAISEAQLPRFDIKHVYSITGLNTSPKAKRNLKMILVPNFLKRKPTDIPSVHEAIKKDLSRIYVY